MGSHAALQLVKGLFALKPSRTEPFESPQTTRPSLHTSEVQGNAAGTIGARIPSCSGHNKSTMTSVAPLLSKS